MTKTYSEIREWTRTVQAGEYLAQYGGAADPGSRCGYSDLRLSEIRTALRARDLRLEADDLGLVVRPVDALASQ